MAILFKLLFFSYVVARVSFVALHLEKKYPFKVFLLQSGQKKLHGKIHPRNLFHLIGIGSASGFLSRNSLFIVSDKVVFFYMNTPSAQVP
jgi:hypothetical protein